MKKIISALLSTLMLLSVFSGLSFTAEAAGFTPRTTAPNANEQWYKDYHSRSTPSCVSYVKARASEILGCSYSNYLASSGNYGGKNWWNTTTKLQRGQTPKPGAIICWNSHVAIVEKVNNGTIEFSEGNSSYRASTGSTTKNVVLGTSSGTYFDYRYNIPVNSSGAPTKGSSSGFLGYIYLVNDYAPTPAPAPVVPSISASTSSINLGINNNTSTSFSVNCNGDFSYLSWSAPNCVDVVGQGWNGSTFVYSVNAKSVGSGTINLSLRNSNDQMLAQTQVSVNVQGASVSVSASSVTLNMDGTKTRTVNISVGGSLPSKYYANYSISNGKCTCKWGEWSNQTIPLTITGSKYGSDAVRISLINSSNNAVIATATISVNVTSNDYTVTFNANGGSGAPAKITTKYGEYITIPNTVPTVNETHTVTFDANGGILGDVQTQYKKVFDYWYDNEGNHYTVNSTFSIKKSITFYAHYSFEKLNATDPTKSNAYFVGWYDKLIDPEEPIGNVYNRTTHIERDVTLYAAWSDTKDSLIGDVTRDGKVSLADVSKAFKYTSGTINLSPIEIFYADVNCDGIVTVAKDSAGNIDYSLDGDVNKLYNYVRGKINYNDLPAIKYCTGFTLKSTPRTKYDYGEDFDFDGVVLQSNYSNNPSVHHYIDEDFVISGYNPYKIGTQTIVIHFYQWTVPLEVTVEAPSFVLRLEANGGVLAGNCSKLVKYNNEYGELETPERTGYNFVGWYTEEIGGTKVNKSTILDEMNDVTVYAHWEKKKFDVDFDCSNVSQQVDSIYNVEYDMEITVPTTVLTKRGQSFEGWSMTPDGDAEDCVHPGESILITEGTTLYPVFEKAEEITEGDIAEYKSGFDGYIKALKFIPESTGDYCFYIEGAEAVDATVMYGSNTLDIKSTEIIGNDYSLTVSLNAGKTYYIYIDGLKKDELFTLDINEVPVHHHDYQEILTTPATCTTTGKTIYECCECDDIVEITISMTAHTEAKDNAVAATCTTAGKTEGSHCSVCGKVIVAQQTVNALGHKWNSGTVTKKATPTATGIKTYTCTVCGTAKTATIPKCAKYANPITAKGKTATVKYANLKNKGQTVLQKNAFAVSKAQGKVTYKKASGNAKITVNSAGKITVKKGLKKGTYKIKVKVTAAGNTTYKAVTKTVTVTIKVK